MDKSNKSGDEKDLEISRLRRENEDLQKSKKNTSEKILEYQSMNERLRKDKQSMEESVNELNKKIEMMDQLAKSAAMVMGKNDFDELDNHNEGGLGGELNDLEDMDNFSGGDPNSQNVSRQNSMIRDNRRATF